MTLSIEGLTASYPSCPAILKDVSLSIESGSLTALAGLNGSGKSTLLAIMAGVSSVCYPHLDINTCAKADGVPLSSMKARERARLISYLPQSEWCAWDYTAREVVLMGRFALSSMAYTKKDREAADDALSLVGMSGFAERSVHTLSGGQWQRVRLARAIASGAPFMLLDEPLTGGDVPFCEDFLALLRRTALERNTGILFSTHDLSSAKRYSSRLAFLDSKGGIESGTTESMMTEEHVARLYGRPSAAMTGG